MSVNWTPGVFGDQVPRHLDAQQLFHAIGVSPLASADVLRVAQRAHATPYPRNWSEQIDTSSGALYFYHQLQGNSSWEHPFTGAFRDIIAFVSRAADDALGPADLLERIEANLEEVRRLAEEDLADWISFDADGALTYFYNERAGQSDWDDPRERWNCELRVRHDLLVGFLDDACARASARTRHDRAWPFSPSRLLALTAQPPPPRGPPPSDGLGATAFSTKAASSSSIIALCSSADSAQRAAACAATAAAAGMPLGAAVRAGAAVGVAEALPRFVKLQRLSALQSVGVADAKVINGAEKHVRPEQHVAILKSSTGCRADVTVVSRRLDPFGMRRGVCLT